VGQQEELPAHRCSLSRMTSTALIRSVPAAPGMTPPRSSAISQARKRQARTPDQGIRQVWGISGSPVARPPAVEVAILIRMVRARAIQVRGLSLSGSRREVALESGAAAAPAGLVGQVGPVPPAVPAGRVDLAVLGVPAGSVGSVPLAVESMNPNCSSLERNLTAVPAATPQTQRRFPPVSQRCLDLPRSSSSLPGSDCSGAQRSSGEFEWE
jgi:hypothetical protein